jgi:3-oxoacyl-(acyl-carrier-protein) synthase
MNRRVVITGLGVVAPNGVGIPDFLHSIQNGISGIKFNPLYEQLNFNCQVSGVPNFEWDQLKNYLPEVTLYGLRGNNIGYAVKAAIDAWTDAGNDIETGEPYWETGCVFGNSVADTEIMKNVFSRKPKNWDHV